MITISVSHAQDAGTNILFDRTICRRFMMSSLVFLRFVQALPHYVSPRISCCCTDDSPPDPNSAAERVSKPLASTLQCQILLELHLETETSLRLPRVYCASQHRRCTFPTGWHHGSTQDLLHCADETNDVLEYDPRKLRILAIRLPWSRCTACIDWLK